MAGKMNILLLKVGEALSSGTVEGLQGKGFNVGVVQEQSQVATSLLHMTDPVLVVDCGAEEEVAYNHVKNLIQSSELHAHPLVVIGKEVDSYETVLKRYFPIVATLTIPCSTVDLIKAVEFCHSGFNAPKVSGATLSKDRVAEATTEAHPVDELYNKFEDVPSIVFHYFEFLGLFNKTIGGATYTKKPSEQTLLDVGAMSPDSRIVPLLSSLGSSAGKWGRSHIIRTGYISTMFFNQFPFPPSLQEDAKVAALLFSWTFAGTERGLLRYDYSGTRQLILRKDLCSKIKDSAMKLALELAQPNAANLVALMGKMIGREEDINDTAESIAVNTIVTADLIDRLCFAQGFWDARVANSLLRKFRSGKARDIHPAVLACSIKFLAEAIAACPTVLYPKKYRRIKPKEAGSEEASEPIQAFEKQVAIPDLSPGMRLSRPILTADGVTLLDPDLLLDRDLIWRLWQLSAIRPVLGPAVVFSALISS